MRTPIFALSALLAACTVMPDVSEYEAKAAGDCPGQKACGYRCVDHDDAAAGCTRDGCSPCPAGPAHTVAVCGSHEACAYACAPGWADCDATPGCERAVASDAASCGACGHACPEGVACVEGHCQSLRTVVATAGVEPRGIALASGGLAWANDPPAVGGAAAQGTLRLADPGTSAPIATLEGVGHPRFVRSLGPARKELAVLGTDPEDDTYSIGWLVDTSAAAPALFAQESTGNGTVGLALTDLYYFLAYDLEWGEYAYSLLANPDATGGGMDTGPITGVGGGGSVHHLWLGQGRYFYAQELVPGRVQQWLDDPADDWGPEYVSGGALYFDELPPGVEPEAHRIAARATEAEGVYAVYFADLRDGSIWTGLTDLSAADPLSATPWRLVRGDGRPRTAMDVAADDLGAVWSDLEAGEIWAVTPAGQKHRLASGVRPWAIAITATEVFFTDVEAQAIRAVPR